MRAWIAPYEQIVAVVRCQGPGALPKPVGDPERARAAFDVVLAWHEKVQARSQAAADRACGELDRARRALRDFENPPTSVPEPASSIGSASRWCAEPIEIRGCRLLMDIGSPGTVRRVTVRLFAQAIVLEVAGERRFLEWTGIHAIGVESLGDRQRVTVPRAAGLGFLSLAAKQRVGWCAMTVRWRDRHVVLEMPVEAHQLRAIFASASITLTHAA
jgi:hypothetical protein